MVPGVWGGTVALSTVVSITAVSGAVVNTAVVSIIDVTAVGGIGDCVCCHVRR